jgi:hypothetical protein
VLRSQSFLSSVPETVLVCPLEASHPHWGLALCFLWEKGPHVASAATEPGPPALQGKTVIQAEIDAAAELIDFFRFNAKFAMELEGEQPISVPPSTNSVVYRGLEVPTGGRLQGLLEASSQALLPLSSSGLRSGHLPLQLHCDWWQPGRSTSFDGENSGS